MQFSQLLTSLTILATLGVASAAPNKDWKYSVGWDSVTLEPTAIGTPISNHTGDASTLSKRTPGGVLLCTDINWGGTCGYAVQPLGVCIALGSDWKNKISSFGPDPGTTCYGYSQNSCSEAQWQFTFPGNATGGLGTRDAWNDRMTNFMCL